jgi:UDP-N-acetylglucosamine enolpyruvyl transferase
VGNHSIQGDVKFADTLRQMGVAITMGDNWIEAAATGKLKAIDADLNHIPDAAMTIAVAALAADGTTTLRNIESWRVKETDRLSAMATELRKLGATVEEGQDYIRITRQHNCLPMPRSTPTTITAWPCVSRWFPCWAHRSSSTTPNAWPNLPGLFRGAGHPATKSSSRPGFSCSRPLGLATIHARLAGVFSLPNPTKNTIYRHFKIKTQQNDKPLHHPP